MPLPGRAKRLSRLVRCAASAVQESASCGPCRSAPCIRLARGWGCQAADDTGAGSANSVFVVNVEGRPTVSPVLLGLVEAATARFGKVGFFQPIAAESYPGSTSGLSRHVELVKAAFGDSLGSHQMTAVSKRQTIEMLAAKQSDELMDEVYSAFMEYSKNFKLTVIAGSHADGPAGTPSSRLELNAAMAATLESPMLMTLDAPMGRSAAELSDTALIAAAECRSQHADILGVLLNRVQQGTEQQQTAFKQEVSERLAEHDIQLFGAIPRSPLLRTLGLDEVAAALDPCQRVNMPSISDNVAVQHKVVASGDLQASLDAVGRAQGAHRPLVLSHASRLDVLLGLMAAHTSAAGPHAGVIVVTGQAGSQLEGHGARILQGMAKSGPAASFIPILATELSTWEAARQLAGASPAILPTSTHKIQEAKELFQAHVDLDALCGALDLPRSAELHPKGFQQRTNRLCLAQPQSIVLPEGGDPRIIKAAAELSAKRLAKIILLGSEEEIKGLAQKANADISQCTIMDPTSSEKMDGYIDVLVEKRKKKQLTPDQARDQLADPNFFGTLMVACGDADGMVSGACHSTAATIRPGLQVLRTKDSPLVSSVFFMCLPDRVLVYGDCAVNVSPTAEQLAQIACTSADTAAAFGLQPRVALLSYSTMGSGAGPDVDLVTEAVRLAKEMRPDLDLEGPLQYDAAVDPSVAKSKVKHESKVAGRATVCIFPDLNSGNSAYKAVQQSTGAVAIGPILQGLSRPVNDLSRGCTVPDIVNTVTCTSVQAMAIKAQI